MATRTKIEQFPKTDWKRDQVDAVRVSHLAHGASSSVLEVTDTEYKLTTTWPVLD
jgi:hypothetical protein